MMNLPALATVDTFRNQIVHCDALTLLRSLPSKSIDLAIMSPPYNMGTRSNGAKACSNSHSNWGQSDLLKSGYDSVDDAMPYDQYIQWQRDILAECMRVIPDTGAIFYNHKWRIQGGELDRKGDQIVAGFPVRQIIIWHRGSGNNHNPAFFSPQYEIIYMIAKRNFYIKQSSTKFGDVWQFPPESASWHPAPFPLELPSRIIASTTARVILDPFAGSGTTLKAAQLLSRDYIGCDNSAMYVEQARARLTRPENTALKNKPLIATEVQQIGLFESPNIAPITAQF